MDDLITTSNLNQLRYDELGSFQNYSFEYRQQTINFVGNGMSYGA